MRNRPKLLKALITTVLGFAAVPVSGWFYGAYRWNAGTQELQARLGAARVPVYPRPSIRVNCNACPLRFSATSALCSRGRPMVTSVRLQHRGTFNIGQITDQQKPFKSE